MPDWFPEPEKRDDTYARQGEGTLSWLARSTVPRAAGYRDFLNRNLSALPAGCRKGIHEHLREERHHQDGLFELIVGRTLQELGAEIECEPEGLPSGKRPDFVAGFPDGTVYVEAARPMMDRELEAEAGPQAPVLKLVEQNVPLGWAADIRLLPRVRPDESRRHIKAFLKERTNVPPPVSEGQTINVSKRFEQGLLDLDLIPQARHGLSAGTKIAVYGGVSYFPDDEAPLRNAVKGKYGQLSKLDRPALAALNMTSTTSEREDLDRALFGVTVSQRGVNGDEVGRYFERSGLFAGGSGKPTISGVLAFPEVGMLRCADPILWVHPRFGSEFPDALNGLEIRRMPDTEPEVRVRRARKANLLKNLGFMAED